MNMTRRTIVLFTFLIVSAPLAISKGVMDENGDVDQGLRGSGPYFGIADDRKIDNVGGVYKPEGLDKYMKRKLEATDSRLSSLEDRLGKIEDKLDDLKSLISKNQSG